MLPVWINGPPKLKNLPLVPPAGQSFHLSEISQHVLDKFVQN